MDERISISFFNDVKIDFDRDKKVFFLTVSVFSAFSELPSSVRSYVTRRENHYFKPYKTYFRIGGTLSVELVQELPFLWGFQPSFREQVLSFKKLAAQSHQILMEIAIEEKLQLVEEHLLDAIFQ